MTETHTLHMIAKCTNNASDWETFKIHRNNLSNIRRQAKHDNVMNMSSELDKPKGIKRFWCYLKVILNGTPTAVPLLPTMVKSIQKILKRPIS